MSQLWNYENSAKLVRGEENNNSALCVKLIFSLSYTHTHPLIKLCLLYNMTSDVR